LPTETAGLPEGTGAPLATAPMSGTVTLMPATPVTGAEGEATAVLTPTSTLVPTFTPVPMATRTPRVTPSSTPRRPASTTAPNVPAPTLVNPQRGDGLTGKPRFVWQWTGPQLASDQFFDLRIWADDEAGLPKESRRGAISLTRATEAEVDLDKVPAIQDYGSGAYFWTVVVVERRCPSCEVRIVGDWGEERPFNYTAPSSGGREGGGGDNPPAPTPE
jgi:hypothetical protein